MGFDLGYADRQTGALPYAPSLLSADLGFKGKKACIKRKKLLLFLKPYAIISVVVFATTDIIGRLPVYHQIRRGIEAGITMFRKAKLC